MSLYCGQCSSGLITVGAVDARCAVVLLDAVNVCIQCHVLGLWPEYSRLLMLVERPSSGSASPPIQPHLLRPC